MNKRTTVWVLLVVLLAIDVGTGTAKRILGSSSRKSSPSRSSPSRVTPSYSRPSSSHSSHSDAAKLSYPNYNSQPNRPASAPAGSSHASAPSYGWNVPQKSGPPPAYSATNPVGGARTNINEKPPAYNPSYGSSSNVHSPISATNVKNTQSGYPGATYHSPSNLPAGATYYPHGGAPAGATYHSPGNLPAGATYHSPGNLPAGATYHSPGNLPAGATYHSPGSLPAGASYHPSGYPAAGGYHPPPAYGGGYHAPAGGASYPVQQLPAGATYVQPGSALPPGAVFMSQPPKSSGPGFGTGLIAGGLTGAIGGALLSNALSPSHSQPSYGGGAPAAASGSDSGSDRIIIINNGQPVEVTDAGKGTTVINTGGAQPAQAGQPAPAPAPGAPAPPAPAPAAPGMNPPADSGTPPLAPMVPLAPLAGSPLDSSVSPNADNSTPTPAPAPAPNADSTPAPGGIICVPVKVNEPDPNDSTKMIEVEKIACYPAPPPEPPVPAPQATSQNLQALPQTTPQSSDSSQVPLAPLQAVPSQETLIGNDAMVRSKAPHFADSVSLKMGMLVSAVWSILYASRIFAC